MIQVTNAASRRPGAGQGLWSAGHHALRALVASAGDELREEGIRVCLLRVDAPIESAKTVQRLRDEGIPPDASADQSEIAEAVAYLAAQPARALSYELGVTASGRPPFLF
jgi:NAD(P)-dependent dehydrogenase (short-subunit alcohol dehydrogenase family)